MQVLVDRGAQINLVHPDITPLTPAKHPLCLQTVDGSTMGGGDRKTRLEMEIPLLTGAPSLRFKDTSYCADMDPKFDIILSYPSLRTHKLGVLPHRNALVYEAEAGSLVLAEGQTSGFNPKYELTPALVSRASAKLTAPKTPTNPPLT